MKKKISLFGSIDRTVILAIRVIMVVAIIAFALSLSVVAKPVAANLFLPAGMPVSENTLKESARYLTVFCLGLITLLLSMAIISPVFKFGMIAASLFILWYYGKLFLISLQKKS
jgi:hypothetical protein